MDNCSQITNRDVENINDEEFFENMQAENRELFKRALSEAIDMKIHEIEEESEDMKVPPPRTAQDTNEPFVSISFSLET